MRVDPIREINWVKNSLANFVDNLIDKQKKKKEEMDELVKGEDDPHKGKNIDTYA